MDAPYSYAKTKSDYIKRFLSRVSSPDKNGCQFWVGNIEVSGYGVFHYKGKEVKAHKFYYEVVLNNGKVKHGLELGHYCQEEGATCNHKNCVVHTRPMTRSENFMMDNWGDYRYNVVVPTRWVVPIINFYKRNKQKYTLKQIADELTRLGYPTKPSTISHWMRGRRKFN